MLHRVLHFAYYGRVYHTGTFMVHIHNIMHTNKVNKSHAAARYEGRGGSYMLWNFDFQMYVFET